MKKGFVFIEWHSDGLRVLQSDHFKFFPWSLRRKFTAMSNPMDFLSDIEKMAAAVHGPGLNAVLAVPRSEMFFMANKMEFANDDMVWMDSSFWVMGLRRDRLKIFVDAFMAVGIRISAMGESTTASAVSFQQSGVCSAHNVTAVLTIADSSAELLFVDGANVFYSRSLPVGDALVEDTQKTFRYFLSEKNGVAPQRTVVLHKDPAKAKSVFGGVETIKHIEFLPQQSDAAVRGLSLMIKQAAGFWIIPPGRNTLAKILAPEHRQTMLAGGAVLFLLLSYFIGGARSHLQQQIWNSKQMLQISQTKLPTARDPASDIFSAVQAQVPVGLHLLDYSYDAERRAIALRGRAADYERVSNFAANLTADGAFRSARAEKSALVTVGKNQVVEFSVDARLR